MKSARSKWEYHCPTTCSDVVKTTIIGIKEDNQDGYKRRQL